MKNPHEESPPRPAATSAVREKEIVVVTGASGCLGFHTLSLLISHDNQVGEIRCLDVADLEPVKLRSIQAKLEEFERLSGGQRKLVRFIRGDIRDINVVEQSLTGADCVLHCAAKVDIWRDTNDQDANELESINVCGTENLLKSAIRFGVGKFVHVSSFEAFTGYPTVYYATENTLPEPNVLLFGPSGLTKKQAEQKVVQYSNNKLARPTRLTSKDSLNAIVVRFTMFYGEHDQYFISKLLRVAKFFGGRLQRFTNVWIKQQPIYVGNAAWSLIRAKQQMDLDQSISGEDFNITDETAIADPFDFFEQFARVRGMRVSKRTLPAMPVFLLIWLFFAIRRFVGSLDVFGWFGAKKTRLQEAKDQDERSRSLLSRQAPSPTSPGESDGGEQRRPNNNEPSACKSIRWHDLIKPQIFFFMCNSLFLNRTKASLRLKYEPLFTPGESLCRSIEWYKTHLEL